MDQPFTMDPRLNDGNAMPDVASNDGSQLRGRLDRVGMGAIEVPVRLQMSDGSVCVSPARANAFVSLDDPDARGIHMSRLFIALQDLVAKEVLSPSLIEACLDRFVESHQDLSKQAELSLTFEHMLERRALKSDNSAWRSYPIEIKAIRDESGQSRICIKVEVAYSSTCPCSAALARQLIQESFRETFAGQNQIPTEQVDAWLATEEAICATPHSQRSYASIEIVPETCEAFEFEAIVDQAEHVLQTAVQAAVKREDEQEFARLNGQNLMFCEDAARRLRHWLDNKQLRDYRVKVTHVESLHPHDAVSIVVKGVADGLKAE